jgi:hypothetical protein
MEIMQRKWSYLTVSFLMMAGVLFAVPIPGQLKQGDVIPELVWSDRSIKKNVKIINLIAGRVILKHDGGTDQLRLADFQKLVQLTNASLEEVRKEGEEKIKSMQEAREAQLKLQSQKPAAAVPSPFGATGTTPPALPVSPTPLTSTPMAKPSPVPANSPFGVVAPPPAVAPPKITPTPSAPVVSPPLVSPTAPPPVSQPERPAPIAPPPAPFPAPAPAVTPQPIPLEKQGEPRELKLLRESIHGRIERLQDEYLTSLGRLQAEFASGGNTSGASRVTQEIEHAEREKAELKKLLREKGTKKKRDIEPANTDIRSVQVAPAVAPTLPEGFKPAIFGNTTVPSVVAPVPAAPSVTIPGKPEQLSNGQVPLVVKSIENGGMSGLDMKRVEKWGMLKQERIEGRPYWTVEVDYQADSIFGQFPARAKALLERGRVVRWVSSPR